MGFFAGDGGAGASRGLRRVAWLVAGAAVLLLAVISGFLLVAHRRAEHFLTGLPKHLGVNVQQESNGFTYDQSRGKRKIFTVHASKQAQMKDGRVALHDVGIVLYGPDGEITDRIHGADFDFDSKQQVISAKGEVFIDLAPPAKRGAPEGNAELRMIHVHSDGLVFSQKDQVASTDGKVDFRAEGYAGSAEGATFDAGSGDVILRSAVQMSGVRDNKPVVLTASHAELQRTADLILLTEAKYVSANDAGYESVAAAHARINTWPDGTPEHVDAEGAVTLTNARHGRVTADQLLMDLNAAGLAQKLHLRKHVRYANDAEGSREQAHMEDAVVQFDGLGRPLKAVLTGAVEGFAEDAKGRRELAGETVNLDLAGGGKAPVRLVRGEAFGPQGARVTAIEKTDAGRNETSVAGTRLVGLFAAGMKSTGLKALDGFGETSLVRRVFGETGGLFAEETSTGDLLHVDFAAGERGRSQLTRAEQRGSVAIARTGLVKDSQGKLVAEESHARSDRANYDAADDTLHLSGGASVQDQGNVVLADRIDLKRASGDALVEGSVRVLYAASQDSNLQTPRNGNAEVQDAKAQDAKASDPVHVLAGRGVLHKASEEAEFFAAPGGRVRMWTSTSQVEAATVELFRKERRMVALSGGHAAVRTVLTADSPKTEKAKAGAQPQQPVVILSDQLTYRDGTKTVEFKGPVRLTDQDGTMVSDGATVWLAPSEVKTVAAGGLGSGRIDHMIAEGDVTLSQPGRKAVGQRLTYTAADGTLVMTGTKAVPPRMEDAVQGATSGAAIRFKTQDKGVEVLSAEPGLLQGKTGERVRSETRVKSQ